MKKLFFVLLSVILILTLSSMISQDDKKGLARVHSVNGVEVYIMSEPVRDYEIVDKMTSSGAWSDLLGTSKPTVSKMVEEMVNRGLERFKKRKIGAFDALMTEDGETAVFIKWK